MLDSDIIYTIIRTFPESIVAILSGLLLLDIKKDKIFILKYGIILGLIVSIIRVLPINFGIHSILSMIAIGVILFNISKESLIKPIIATCQIWISLALSEGIYMVIAMGIFKLDFEQLISNKGLPGAVITLPSLLIFLMIVLIFVKINNKLKNRQ